MNQTGSIQMSQGFEVLQPKSGPAFPIPCREWDVLKEHARRFSTQPWFFHTLGSILIGSALATWVSIMVGTFDAADRAGARTVAWAVVVAAFVSGLLSMVFAHMQRGDKKRSAADLVTQMDLIEDRFERPSGALPRREVSRSLSEDLAGYVGGKVNPPTRTTGPERK